MAKKTREDVENKLSAIQAKTYADTVAGKIESIEDHAELLGIETNYLGLTAENPKFAVSATAVAGIISKGVITETVKEGDTYTLTAGYYEGGTITGIKGGGNYTLQEKSWTPTTSQQVITPDAAYYGLSKVTVAAIPTKYKDTTGATATADQVLDGATVVTTAGTVEGTMVNNGAVAQTIYTSTPSYRYTVPVGYHNGKGTVTVATQTKTVTPTESEQTITGDSNKFLTSVTVEAIDKATYLTSWTSDADATSDDILKGAHAYINGTKVTGTMTDNSAWDATAHVLTTGGSTGEAAIAIPEGYHDGTGAVKIDAQNKTAAAPVPGGKQQTITADSGKVLNQVIVPALDAKYQDVSAVTAVASHVCEGYKFVNSSGTVVTGTLPEKGNHKNQNFYNDLMASGSTGVTVLTGTEGHYTAVEATIDGSLYNRLAAI